MTSLIVSSLTFTRSTRCDRVAKRFTVKERASYRAGYDAGWLAAHQKVARSFNKAKKSGWVDSEGTRRYRKRR